MTAPRNRTKGRWLALSVFVLVALVGRTVNVVAQPMLSGADPKPEVSLDEARAIAKEATVYGFPLVDNYRIQYSYFVDTSSPEYKADWNTIYNNARVYTPDDKAIQTPNSDTPHSCRAGRRGRSDGHVAALGA